MKNVLIEAHKHMLTQTQFLKKYKTYSSVSTCYTHFICNLWVKCMKTCDTKNSADETYTFTQHYSKNYFGGQLQGNIYHVNLLSCMQNIMHTFEDQPTLPN